MDEAVVFSEAADAVPLMLPSALDDFDFFVACFFLPCRVDIVSNVLLDVNV